MRGKVVPRLRAFPRAGHRALSGCARGWVEWRCAGSDAALRGRSLVQDVSAERGGG